jgi:hypothetical protein
MSLKRLNILAVDAIHEGQTNGRNWTIYGVTALNEAGDHIEQKLRSFDELPLGDGTYEVEAREYKGEQQFTIKLPGAGGGGGGGGGSSASANPGARLGPKVDELRQRLDNTDRVVTQQGDEIAELKAAVRALADGRSPASLPADTPKPKPASDVVF